MMFGDGLFSSMLSAQACNDDGSVSAYDRSFCSKKPLFSKPHGDKVCAIMDKY